MNNARTYYFEDSMYTDTPLGGVCGEYVEIFDILLTFNKYSMCVKYLDSLFFDREDALKRIAYYRTVLGTYLKRRPDANIPRLSLILAKYGKRWLNIDKINAYGEEEYYRHVAIIKKIVFWLKNGVETTTGIREFTIADFSKSTNLSLYQAWEICKGEFEKDDRDVFKAFVDRNTVTSTIPSDRKGSEYPSPNRNYSCRNIAIEPRLPYKDRIYTDYMRKKRKKRKK